MPKHENETHEIIRQLAKIELTMGASGPGERFNDLVKRARVLEEHLPPIMHDAAQTRHHDDYLATLQLAVGIDREGRIIFKKAVDCDPAYLLPLIAGLRFQVQSLEGDLTRKLRVTDAELEQFVKPIVDGLKTDDFQQKWDIQRENLPADQGGSRTSQNGNLIIPES